MQGHERTDDIDRVAGGSTAPVRSDLDQACDALAAAADDLWQATYRWDARNVAEERPLVTGMAQLAQALQDLARESRGLVSPGEVGEAPA